MKDGSCLRCQDVEETFNHVLFQCPYARLTWAMSPVPAPPRGEWSDSLFENIDRLLTEVPKALQDNNETKIGPWILWRLWNSRNVFCFQGVDYDVQSLLNRTKENMEE